ncbi:MAG: glycoside hydrolase family 16 protein [Bacteroidota bacterium]
MNISKTYPLYLVFGLLFFGIVVTSCEVDEGQILEDRQWQLTWSDEFEGDAGTAPDPSKWTYDIGRGDNGWGNLELQYYTDNPENVSLDGEGNLVITARRETFGGAPFTSARIKTQGLFAQAYGRFEARMKTPDGPGVWPAFWMVGENIETVSWPQCGEIDVMELRGQQPNVIAGTLHGPGYFAGESIGASYSIDGRFDADFSIFAVEWGENYVDFFVDDVLYQRLTPADVTGEWVYNQPFFMLLNVAVGGSYVGFPTDRTPLPQEMIVDYVRVYEQTN